MIRSLPLFEQIHDGSYFCDRMTPTSMEEFISFGLEPKDYVYYVALQHRLQSELMLFGAPKSESYTTSEYTSSVRYPTLEKLISFCTENNLIYAENYSDNTFYYLGLFNRDDAEYYHDWFRYPKDEHDFRLAIERKLTRFWDPEDAYITETCGSISFDYDEYTEYPNGSRFVEFNSPVRVKKYDPQKNKFTYLSNSEVRKLLEIIQRDKLNIETEIAHHLSLIPISHDPDAITNGLPWVKKMFELYDRQGIIEDVYETMSRAASTPDLYRFKENDVLTVFCGNDICKEAKHLLSSIRVEFSFYGKPDKQYTIQRCAHCKEFRISLHELIAMFEDYGVPRAQIVYEGESGGDFSDFAETSIFYDMGYTVSQSVGLSAARRQGILRNAIETGKASKYQILSFLKQRMNINGMKSGNELAFRKWKEDYDYVMKL